MLKTRFEWTILLILAALLGGAWIVWSQETAVSSHIITLTEAPVVGHKAPVFTLATVTEHPVSLQNLVGQPVVLNFWASWCMPCRVEMPHLQEASQQYHGRAAIIGVNQGETSQTVAQFGAEYNISYPLLVDSELAISQLYGVAGLPTTLFIDADGVVREVIMGTVNLAVIEDRLDGLLAEAATSTQAE